MTFVPPPPPDPCDMRYGQTLKAGTGEATIIADFDFETYSEAGLRYVDGKWTSLETSSKRGISAVGAYRYAEHPSTDVLCLAYNLKDGTGKHLWVPGMDNPQDLFDHVAAGRLLEAWNVSFEEAIWNSVCVQKFGWPRLDPSVLRCAMAKSRAFCLPGALGKAAEALALDEQKDTGGKRLLGKFSVPRNPTKSDDRTRFRPLSDPEGPLLYRYCLQDIVTEAEASARIPDLSNFELAYWQVDQDCNRRGVRLDMAAIENSLAKLGGLYGEANQRIVQLTQGHVANVNQVQKITEWVNSQGVIVDSIDENSINRLLDSVLTPPHVRDVLELRKSVGSAAVKKLYAMKTQATSQGRAHGMFIYHGARTGRDAGAGIQPQNMPNSGPVCCSCDCGAYYSKALDACPSCGVNTGMCTSHDWDADSADFALGKLATNDLERYFPRLLEVLPGCIRGMLIADEGCDFIGSDYSAIEAVVAACLSGCQWRIDTFRRKDDIYLASISAITGVSVEEYKQFKEDNGYHHPDRKKGKVAELASGYGGWTGAWKQFGADDFFSSEDELIEAIKAWRNASPEIVEAWGGQMRYGQPRLFGLEGAFIASVQSPGATIETGLPGITYYNRAGAVYCYLPSGRYITYHSATIEPDSRRRGKQAIYFWGYNTNPKMGPMGWTRLNTYGGRLFENCVQAVARDIMAHAAVNLHHAGYHIALRVHDELVAHVPEGRGSVEEFEAIANRMPQWAKDWPVSVAGGYRAKRFRK